MATINIAILIIAAIVITISIFIFTTITVSIIIISSITRTIATVIITISLFMFVIATVISSCLLPRSLYLYIYRLLHQPLHIRHRLHQFHSASPLHVPLLHLSVIDCISTITTVAVSVQNDHFRFL